MLYKTIDLCAGIGGIRRGFELSKGFENVCSAEIDDLACKTYEQLFHENPKNDITSEDFKEQLKKIRYDVLLAGFPCQSFSSVGLRKGFEDKTKGTIFFDIAKIIEQTHPKVVFLENVENLVIHDNGHTFQTIIETFENELNYHVIGVSRDNDGNLVYKPKDFIRNSKFFGIPQNRPRVYIIAFSRAHFGRHIDRLPKEIPVRADKIIYKSVLDVLEKEVSERYFLSSGYLKTLEDHCDRQKKKGYGFGYRIINEPGIDLPIANTLLATGGSGRERNLIFDQANGPKYAGMTVKGKYSPINSKCIRMMTPVEWGRLQGFIDYAFVRNGIDEFSFPEGVPNVQKYKQLGNSVTIPVIETMAKFVLECLDLLSSEMTSTELRIQSMYNREFLICNKLYLTCGTSMRADTINRLFDLVYHFSKLEVIHTKDISDYLGVTSARGSQIVKQLCSVGCMQKSNGRGYTFCP